MTPKEKKAVVECVVSLADIHARLEDEEVVKESAAVLKKMEAALGIEDDCDKALLELLAKRMKEVFLNGFEKLLADLNKSLNKDEEDEEE